MAAPAREKRVSKLTPKMAALQTAEASKLAKAGPRASKRRSIPTAKALAAK